MSPPINVAVHGAAGRMGQSILRLLGDCDDLSVVAVMVRPGSSLDGIAVSVAQSALLHASSLDDDLHPQVLIDFSNAAAFDGALALAVKRRIAFISGTTGLDARQRDALDRAAAIIPVLWSANFSLGVAVLARLVAQAAKALPGWDCEIAESHHSGKKDAPSGTAIALGREAAAARGQDFDRVAQLSGSGNDAPRMVGEIGFAVTRGGDIVGEHTVLFATRGERIELTHRATDRDIFARGAIEATRWIAGRDVGRYTVSDVVAGSSA
ncbi:MAG: 4-hydroxy-tetrahydrodipicolinate reductase [Dokdonella sp.]|uniref:4-hydroxy-tetrahydrodipicolinate reductase n=1 Tax=Dokdonella sp. TaxID=2291710 RepID=UPI0032639E3C